MTAVAMRLMFDGILSELNEDEREVVLGVALKTARRVQMGRKVYGPLVIDDDGRNWLDEMQAETLDGSVYGEIGAIQRARRR